MITSRSLSSAFGMSMGLLALLSCGGSNGGGSVINPTPVQAQTYTYSTASLSGTYALLMQVGDDGSIVSPVTLLGTLVLDGSGHISSGSLTEAATPYESGGAINCPFTASGTYTLSSTASGTATLSLSGASVSSGASTGNGAPPCFLLPPTIALNIEAAQQGSVWLYQIAPGSVSFNFAGTAYKQ